MTTQLNVCFICFLKDYLMVIPIQQFSQSDLNPQPIDNSAHFLQWCVGPGFVLV